MSESATAEATTEPGVTGATKSEAAPVNSEAAKVASSEPDTTKPAAIDTEKSKNALPGSSVAERAKAEPTETKNAEKPIIDLTQYASSVDPKAPKPTGSSDTEPPASTKDSALAEGTDKLAISDDTADEKAVETSAEFKKLAEQLIPILDEAKYDEMWGVTLISPADQHIPTQVVLQKFLNANDNDPTKAIEQFKAALKWRKKTDPLNLLKKKFNAKKFDDLGFVTDYPPNKDGVKEVITWNVYGSAQGRMDDVFGNLEEFMTWRIALQELGLQLLNLSSATTHISSAFDPYKITQVHDYKSITFFSQPASVKTASREVIRVFGANYPELLKEKFFVNVPAVMGWLYAAVKLVVPAKTAKKFHPMADGGNLVKEFSSGGVEGGDGIGEKLPREYGGKGEDDEKRAWRLWSDGSNKGEGKGEGEGKAD